MFCFKFEKESQDITKYTEDIVYVRDENGNVQELAYEVSEDVTDN